MFGNSVSYWFHCNYPFLESQYEIWISNVALTIVQQLNKVTGKRVRHFVS